MAIRLKDIARDLNVSAVTVSKALRGCDDISTETKERVLKRIKELNYRPNLAARSLVIGRTSMIGLVVPGLVHAFFAEIAQSIAKTIRKKGYSLIVSSSEEDPELERQEIDHLLAHRVDALIIASVQWSVETFRRIEEQNVPYVLIDRRFAGLQANFVGVDDLEVGYLAVKHLIGQGCRRIAHIRGPQVSTDADRFEGFRRALAESGLVLNPEYIVGGQSGDSARDKTGHKSMQQLLALDQPPDGVFCHNDAISMGALRAILGAGLRVPEDLAVIGCGNVHYTDLLRVPLSTMDQGSASIGSRAASLAMRLIEAKASVRPRTVLVKPRVVMRASTDRPPAAPAR